MNNHFFFLLVFYLFFYLKEILASIHCQPASGPIFAGPKSLSFTTHLASFQSARVQVSSWPTVLEATDTSKRFSHDTWSSSIIDKGLSANTNMCCDFCIKWFVNNHELWTGFIVSSMLVYPKRRRLKLATVWAEKNLNKFRARSIWRVGLPGHQLKDMGSDRGI